MKFIEGAIRLLRTHWDNPNQLAEEIYSMLKQLTENPTTLIRPLTVITDTQPAITINGRDGVDGADGISINDETLREIIGRLGGGGGGGIPGEVVSGSGDTYTVTIYPNGLLGTTENVTVTQLQIDAGETIPAGTWAIVTQMGDGEYAMVVPVWL
jgi:hypothetical protein